MPSAADINFPSNGRKRNSNIIIIQTEEPLEYHYLFILFLLRGLLNLRSSVLVCHKRDLIILLYYFHFFIMSQLFIPLFSFWITNVWAVVRRKRLLIQRLLIQRLLIQRLLIQRLLIQRLLIQWSFHRDSEFINGLFIGLHLFSTSFVIIFFIILFLIPSPFNLLLVNSFYFFNIMERAQQNQGFIRRFHRIFILDLSVSILFLLIITYLFSISHKRLNIEFFFYLFLRLFLS